jgi:hypothetical protein
MIANSWQIKRKRLGRFQGCGVKNYLSKVGWRGSVVFSDSFFASMKPSWVIIALVGISVTAIPAQEAPYQVTERGANHRVWQRTIYETGPDGRPMPHVHQYTELATGLHYLNHGQWIESKEQIDLLPDGTAAATQGQHQVWFPADIYSGVIKLVTPEGRELTSRPLGLSYDDGSNAVLIAELTHSVGQLVGANQALYPDAFTRLKADLLYTYTRAGFEQYVILREAPLTPESFGLAPARARLQVLTEFFNAPEPAVTTTVRPGQAGMSLPDQNVAFGAMAMMPGRAFLLGGEAPPGNVMVSKSWVKLEGRQFLIEEVPVEALADQLAALPLPPEASTRTGATRHSVASRQRQLPPPRQAQAGSTGPFTRIARAALPARGLVLDYQIVNGSETPYNFKSDTTYYISGNVCAYGTNTFEGGAVLKFATNGEIQITPGPVSTRINWKAGACRPVIFTAKDDDSVGDSISESTGHPSGYYGDPMLFLASLDSITLTNLRVSYAATGIGFGGVIGNFYDVQFVHCQQGLKMGGVDLFLGNALFADSKTNFVFQGGAAIVGQNITFDGAACLAAGPAYYAANSLALTNCILSNESALTNGILTLAGDYNGFYNSPGFGANARTNTADPFQTAGNACYYLATNSAFGDVGTTNIDPDLLAKLRTMTTCAPQDGGWVDTNTPDLGYHYPVNEDSDYDGLTDWWEWQHFGGWNQTAGGDFDYDGANNLQEYLNGTDPAHPDNAPPWQLGRWRFDSTNTWAGEAGQLPLVATNVGGVRSWNTNAVLINNTKPAILCYRDTEANGQANVNLRKGTIRFWFKPDWGSTDHGGAGPGTSGRLIEAGNYHPEFTNGWWALYLNAEGSQLTFGSSTNGAGNTNLSASVSWAYKRWHQIALTYSPTNAILYCDGQPIATDETGPNYYPGLTERTNGFRIGSDANGGNQAGGTFEDLETFNYQLTATDITNNFAAVSLPEPPTVTITNLMNDGSYLLGTNQSLTIEVETQAGAGRSIQQVEYSYFPSSQGPTCLNNLSTIMVDPPIGTATQPPFSFAWLNADWTNGFAATYDITAFAVDDLGIASDSATVSSVSVAADFDGDGIPEWWMLWYFGHPTGEVWDHSMAGNDADGDGVSNLQEYRNGTGPTDYYDGGPNPEIILRGNNQSGNYDSFLSLPITITVQRTDFVTLAGATVDFAVDGGTALLVVTTNDSPASALHLETDANGMASVWVYFPPAGPDRADSTILITAYDGSASATVAAHEYVPLARWHFNDTNTWAGEAVQLPVLTNNLTGTPSWSSNAVRIDSSSPARLAYSVVEANDSTNINCQTGSVLFYFKPAWSSANAGGNGPGVSGRLIEIGRYSPELTNGWWSLYLNPDGTQLLFATSTNGNGMTNLTASISWVSNAWHQVALTYSCESSALFVDGQLAANGAGVVYLPNADELADGFRIGSDENGDNQAGGVFDELETFASPLNFGITPAETYWLGIPDYQADPNGTLRDWLLAYFGHLGVNPYGDYDDNGTNNWQEFMNGADPNKISFSFSVPNQYVTNNPVDGVITILGGVPSSMAVLVDSANFGEAIWTNYTASNIVVNIGTTPEAHDVWIGLRGRLTNSYQTWEGTTLILNPVPPTIAITNPTDSAAFNASRVNVSGWFASTALKQITVNNTLAFTNGTNFEARNVPLASGANTVTAVIEDLTGITNAVCITMTGNANLDGSLNDPVQLQATPVAGFEPLTVTFQITSNGAPGTLQSVLWDFNGDGLTDFTTNNPGPVAYAYTNGEYFPVITLQTTDGRFSSIGGWNAVSLDSTNAPIRINVQVPATQTTLAGVTDPVDLKWDGVHLYVLSGSGAAIYEFATNGDIIRLKNNIGAVPSGFDVDGAGNIYVVITNKNQVWKFNPTEDSFVADTNFGIGGHIGLTNGTSGTTNGAFNAPYDVAVTTDGGTISVSDSGNHRIQQFSTTNGAFIVSFGSQGSDVGQFNAPKGLTYDAYGTLYIVDSGNNRLVLAQGSAVIDASGSGGNGLGQFSSPLNMSIGKRGVYIADTGNGWIQKFDMPPQGLFEITSGSASYALSTNLSSPAAVAAVDHLTNELFYVADTGHNQVLLCQVPDNNADQILAVWNGMTNCVVQGDISGAAKCFSYSTADEYLRTFLGIGISGTISDIQAIGPLTPVYIRNGLAQYYFEQSINGQTLLFTVKFQKENGVWKIWGF